MPVSIFFHPEGYTKDKERLMGRHVAGASFLDGFLQYARPTDEIFVKVESLDHVDIFLETVSRFSRPEKITPVTRGNLGRLKSCKSLFLPGPGLAKES